MTPSRASFSFIASSFLCNQYSNTPLLFLFKLSNVIKCAFSSSSSNPCKASSVVLHTRTAALASNSGGGGGPLLREDSFFFWPPVFDSMEVDESFALFCFSRSTADVRGEVERLMFGRTRRFCFEGGSISSKSTGTPRETRKRRRMRDLVQLGGCIGGGDTSCCHRERERSERKGEELDLSKGGISEGGRESSGKMAERYESRSEEERSRLRSKAG